MAASEDGSKQSPNSITTREKKKTKRKRKRKSKEQQQQQRGSASGQVSGKGSNAR